MLLISREVNPAIGFKVQGSAFRVVLNLRISELQKPPEANEPLNPEPLNPEPLNPEPLNPEPLNPEPVKPGPLNQET